MSSKKSKLSGSENRKLKIARLLEKSVQGTQRLTAMISGTASRPARDSGNVSSDSGMKNKFRAEWLNDTTMVKYNGKEYVVGLTCFEKINEPDVVKCNICRATIRYGSAGKKALKIHVSNENHLMKYFTLQKNKQIVGVSGHMACRTPIESRNTCKSGLETINKKLKPQTIRITSITQIVKETKTYFIYGTF